MYKLKENVSSLETQVYKQIYDMMLQLEVDAVKKYGVPIIEMYADIYEELKDYLKNKIGENKNE